MDAHISENAIILSSYWFRSTPEISWNYRLQWSKNLTTLFSDDFSNERILLYSLREVKYVEEVNEEIIAAAYALTLLIRHSAELNNDLSFMNSIDDVIEGMKIKYEYDEKLVLKYYKQFEEKLDTNEQKKKIFVPTSINPLLIDHGIRWLLLYLKPELGDWIFWALNLVVLPAAVIFYSIKRTSGAKVNSTSVLESYGGISSIKLIPSRNALQLTMLAFLVVIGNAVTILITESYLEIVLTLVALLSYYAVYLKHFSFKSLTESMVVEQLSKIPRYEMKLSADENDEVIVNQASRLKSIVSRLEAYVLESALFGALAFSGFLQIMAEELVTFEKLKNLGDSFFAKFSSLVYFNFPISGFGEDDLFTIIAVETLVCSMLFLVVIASRLKYSDVSDKVTRFLDMARSYNEKEEALLAKGDLSEDETIRMAGLNQKIYSKLVESDKGLDEMTPVSSFMRLFRNAGIFSFIFILITSALLVSQYMSWIFTLLGVASITYFAREQLSLFLQKSLYGIRWILVRSSKQLVVGAVLFLLLGFLLRISTATPFAGVLIILGFVSLGAYLFAWIALVPHYDHVFETEETRELGHSSKWRTLKFIWGFSLLISVLGYSMVFLDIRGGAVFTAIGCSTLAVVFLIVGPLLTRPKFVGVLSGIAMAGLVMGYMFKTLHFPGSNALFVLGFVLASVVTPFYLIYSKPRWEGGIITIAFLLLFIGTILKIFESSVSDIIIISGIVFSVVSFLVSIYKPLAQKLTHRIYSVASLSLIAISVSLYWPGYSIEQVYTYSTYNVEDLSKVQNMLAQAEEIEFQLEEAHEDHSIDFLGLLDNYAKDLRWYVNYLKENNIALTSTEEQIIKSSFSICVDIQKEHLQEESALEKAYEIAEYTNNLGQLVGYDMAVFRYVCEGKDEYLGPKALQLLEPYFLEKLKQTEMYLSSLDEIYRADESRKYEDFLWLEIQEFFPKYNKPELE